VIGESLAWLAKGVLHRQTYESMIAPVIADLQHEAHDGTWARLRAYGAVWRAIVGALADDVHGDTAAAMSAMVRWTSLAPALATTAGVAGLLMLAFDVHRLEGPALALLPLLAASVMPLALLPALAVAAHQAARDRVTTRGFAFTGVVIAAFLLLFIDQGVTRTNQVFREIEGRARGIAIVLPGSHEMSLAELRHFDPATSYWSGHEKEFAREAARRIGTAASVIAYVLFGVALTRRRMRTFGAVLIAIVTAHVALDLLMSLASSQAPDLIRILHLTPAIILIAAALVVARRAARTGR
jgi:uncharacterized membrane protein YwaF